MVISIFFFQKSDYQTYSKAYHVYLGGLYYVIYFLQALLESKYSSQIYFNSKLNLIQPHSYLKLNTFYLFPKILYSNSILYFLKILFIFYKSDFKNHLCFQHAIFILSKCPGGIEFYQSSLIIFNAPYCMLHGNEGAGKNEDKYLN